MPRTARATPASDTASTVQDIASDAQKLIEQQFQLLRSELADEFHKLRGAGLAMGSGAGLVAVGGILGTAMLVHLLHDKTRLPLWGCYGLVGGLFGIAGAGLLSTGIAEASGVRLLPPQTEQTLREDARSIKRAVAGSQA